MIAPRWQAVIALGVVVPALIGGLIAARGSDDDVDALAKYSDVQAGRMRERALARERIEAAAAAAVPQELRVDLAATGAASIDGVALTNDELTARFASAAALDPKPSVEITLATGVAYPRVIEVMDLATKAGLAQIGLAEPAAP